MLLTIPAATQKHPPRGVLRKRSSENMQQIYRRTPTPKRDLQSNFTEITLRHGCSSVNLMHISELLFLTITLDGCFWTCSISKWILLICCCSTDISINLKIPENRSFWSNKLMKKESTQSKFTFSKTTVKITGQCVKFVSN